MILYRLWKDNQIQSLGDNWEAVEKIKAFGRWQSSNLGSRLPWPRGILRYSGSTSGSGFVVNFCRKSPIKIFDERTKTKCRTEIIKEKRKNYIARLWFVSFWLSKFTSGIFGSCSRLWSFSRTVCLQRPNTFFRKANRKKEKRINWTK